MNIAVFDKRHIDSPALLKALRQDGIIIIPDFLNAEALDGLRNEFSKILLSDNNEFITRMDYSLGSAARVTQDKIDASIFPHTLNCFSDARFKKISEQYLKGKVALNHEIYAVKDVVGSKHVANDLHFDVLRAFKFFIYLTDTTVRNGAFACVPGSHVKANKIRAGLGDRISYENRELTRELPYRENDAVPVEGKAGSLIIFDTDVFHRAGNVSEGERWVMRGHTRLLNAISGFKLGQSEGFFSKLKKFFNVS